MCTILRESTERVARKLHRCSGCGGSILPGWRYVETGLVSSDGPYSWREHVPCHAAAHRWWADNPGEEIDDGWLEQSDDPHDEAVRLAVGLGLFAASPEIAADPHAASGLASQAARAGETALARRMSLLAIAGYERWQAENRDGQARRWECAVTCERLNHWTPWVEPTRPW